jgi:DNA-binding CsgD family transcriptional regulator
MEEVMDALSKLTGIVSEKDCSSVVTKCNKLFLEYAGVKSKDKILGFTDYDFPWSEYADFYRAHELDAISGNNYSAIIPFYNHKKERLLFLHTKIQKLNKEKEVSGVLCHAVELINPDVHKLVDILSENSSSSTPQFSIGKQINEITLPKRQEEALFYLIRGKSAKSIAKIMKISFRTVEYYIEILKNKFNCQNKNELIEAAINKGFSEHILQHENISNLVKKLKIT